MVTKTSSDFRSFFLLYFTNEIVNHLKPKKIIPKVTPKKQIAIQKRKPSQIKKQVIRVPKTKLPPHLQYLKPTSNQGIELDLEKIESLIKDPMVKEIECNGPDEHLITRGTTGTKETNIVLTKQDISKIVQEFSKNSKTPANEGLFKVFVGKFVFSAIISNITGSKFIITKLNYNPNLK